MIAAIDAGNFETKFYDGVTFHRFPSVIGFDWRERNVEQQQGDYDFDWEYDGQRGFAGTLAQYESWCAESRKGDSKAHIDAKLRILIALHQFSNDTEHQIVVGQPFGKHNPAEKESIKSMLLGRHEMTVNGKHKVFVIRRCEVSPEGLSAGLLINELGTIRIIDVGSGTVNYGTLIDRKRNDKGSFTLPLGMETMSAMQPAAFARMISIRAEMLQWQKTDRVFLCGGGAEAMAPHIREYFPNATVIVRPNYANVRAFYLIARKLYGA